MLTKPIAYFAIYKILTNSTNAAVFLSQAIYWQKRSGGEYYKTQADWQKETGLSRREQETARRILRELGILKEQAKGLPRRLYYQVDIERLTELLSSLQTTQTRRKAQSAKSKKSNSVCRKAPYKYGADVQSSMAQPAIQVCTDAPDKSAHSEPASEHHTSTSQCDTLEKPQSLEKQELREAIRGSVPEMCMLDESGVSQHVTTAQTGKAGQDSASQCDTSAHTGDERQVIVKQSLSGGKSDCLSAAENAEQALDSETDKSARFVHTSMHALDIQVCTNAPHFTTTYVSTTIRKESKTENKAENKTENKTDLSLPLFPKESKDVNLTILSSQRKKFAANGANGDGDSCEQVFCNTAGDTAGEDSSLQTSASVEPTGDDSKAPSGELAETAKKPLRRTKSPENYANYVPEGKNAIAGTEAASKTKRKASVKAKNEDDVFRGEFFAFAKKAIDWIVRHGGVREDPASYWTWARKLRQRDERITVPVLEQCFNYYASAKGGSWWRSNTKTFKQFVAAFNDIYQSYQHTYQHSYQHTYQHTYQQKGAINDETSAASVSRGGSGAAHPRIARAQEYWSEWLAISKRAGLAGQRVSPPDQRVDCGDADASRQSVSLYRPLPSGSDSGSAAELQPDGGAD